MPGLEELLATNNKLMTEHNDLLKQIILKAGGTIAADKKAPAAGKKDEGLSVETVKPIVANWLREFTANENDPENEARADKFTAALKNLGVEKIGEIKTEADLTRLLNWTKKQVANGRITPAPVAGGSDLDAGGSDDI